jgi:hypothetical protein
MKRQLGIDFTDERLEAVGDLAMPGQELGAAVDVGCLMNLVLFEPPAHAARRHVARISRIIPVIQLLDGVAQHGTFCRINVCDVSSDSISQCHICTLLRWARSSSRADRVFSNAKIGFSPRRRPANLQPEIT